LTGEGEGEGAPVEGANEGHEEEGTIGSEARGERVLPEQVNWEAASREKGENS